MNNQVEVLSYVRKLNIITHLSNFRSLNRLRSIRHLESCRLVVGVIINIDSYDVISVLWRDCDV